MKMEDCLDPEKLEDGEWTPCEGCSETWELKDLRQSLDLTIDEDLRGLMLCPECLDKLEFEYEDNEED